MDPGTEQFEIKYNGYNEEYGIRYCKVLTPILNQILENRKESRRLAELRDTLLPRLMSGELKVQNIDLINEMLAKGIR